MGMQHFNLLEEAGLPQKKKRTSEVKITNDLRRIARDLDFDFYDGKRENGYGGYYYDGRWRKVAELATERYGLDSDSKVLIDRCHKGFLVYDLKYETEGLVIGIMESEYPLNHAMEGYGRWARINEHYHLMFQSNFNPELVEQEVRNEISPYLLYSNNLDLPFKDDYFDTFISIENTCVYPSEENKLALSELIRVTKDNGKNSYIQNDSFENEHQEKALRKWTKLCQTVEGIEWWEDMYRDLGYEGDYGFTIIE
jgi:hypothetical protein